MRHRLFTAAAAAAAVALLLAGCRTIESSSRTTHRETSKSGVTVKSVSTVYVVQRGDTLYSIAKQECGSGAAVDALAEVNVGRRQPDGTVMKDPDVLRPGWRLVLSCEAASD
jgi:nucleoid-associated protein YgaU